MFTYKDVTEINLADDRDGADDLLAPQMTRLSQERSSFRGAVVAASLVVGCGLAPVALALAPRPGEPVAVLTLFPDAAVPSTVAASGAPILWLSSRGHVVVLDAAGRDAAADLHRAGALLVLAAGPLGPCLPGFRFPSTLVRPTQP